MLRGEEWSSLRCDSQWLGRALDDLARIGAVPGGGVTRRALTPEERQAMELVRGWMEDLGLRTGYDAAGNLFGTWAPPGAGGAPVMTGSHVDSVPHGGRYDGAAGVVAALAAVAALQRAGHAPRRPVRVAVFTGEEASRFPVGLMGSTAVVRGLSEEELDRVDEAGVSLRDALPAASRLDAARIRPGDLTAFLEVHIEQGRVLEDAGLPVGLVTGIAGPVFFRGSLRGAADHAGATPMPLRRDALAGAAEFVLAAERIARETGPTTVATVGWLQPHPGAGNVIPGLCEFSLDLRDIDPAARDRAEAALRDALAEIARRRDLAWELKETHRVDPVPVPEHLIRVLERAAEEAGVSTMRLVSGAAHDAMIMARVAPAGMIFVRCREGRSHTPDEYATVEDLTAAADVLAGALAALSA
ncbi:MAG TPA: M20 family metallo-hydrolase [Bacillota bacterium]